MSAKITLTYNELKSVIIGKGLSWQHVENAKLYRIFALDSDVMYQTEIWKSGQEPRGLDTQQNSTDRDDFEQNYKTASNKAINPRTSDGLPKVLAAVSPDDVSLYVTGSYAAITDENDNFADSNFQEEVLLQGMVVSVKGASLGDLINVEVGYESGGSWVPLKKFGENVPMKDEAGWQEYTYKNNAVSIIPDNLKIRTSLTSASYTGKKILVHYITHK